MLQQRSQLASISTTVGTSSRDSGYDRTFRVRGVPSDWNQQQLEAFLREWDPCAIPTVESLAEEIRGRAATATVTFRSIPLGLLKSNGNRPCLIRLPYDNISRRRYLSLDDIFEGITTLYTPASHEHKINVIAVCGLGGHAFGSFKEKGGSHVWLRDSLPYDLADGRNDSPMARIMSYGYDSVVAESTSMQNLEDVAISLYNSILPLAEATICRPIIFIGHSLGGLVIKQFLISLAKSQSNEDKRLLEAVYGIAFFGVPHHGMDITSLIPMVGNSPNRFLLESINNVNSQILTTQHREFSSVLGKEGESEVICFYETLMSPTAQKNELGKWEMRGTPAVLVTKSSATHCRSWETGVEHICPISRNHSEIVKFGYGDSEYEKVIERLKKVAERALAPKASKRTSNPKFLVPYKRNPDFVGRKDVLDNLKHQLGLGLHQISNKPRPRVSLYGLGGVGKTQIAIEYAYWVRDVDPRVSIFWIHGGNAARFCEGYMAIAKEYSIPGFEDPKVDVLSLVSNWLEKEHKPPWLLVLDNADDDLLFFSDADHSQQAKVSGEVNNLGIYIPESEYGHILVTTRNKKAGVKLTPGNSLVEVEKMSEDEAREMVGAILDRNKCTSDEAFALASHLEFLPLAIAQAAAFVQENTISVKEYVRRLEASNDDVIDLLSEPFQTVGRDPKMPHALVATWILSFEQIKQHNRLASSFLSFMCLLDRQAIPQTLVAGFHRLLQEKGHSEALSNSKNCSQTDPEGCSADAAQATANVLDTSEPSDLDFSGINLNSERLKALGVLKAFSFITETKDGSYDMHRLIQMVTQKWLAKGGLLPSFAQQALFVAEEAFPYGEFETRDICAALLPHVVAILKLNFADEAESMRCKASLLEKIGTYYLFLQRFNDAVEVFEWVAATAKAIFGVHDMHAIRNRYHLASAYQYQGRLNEAERLQDQTLEGCKIKVGLDHPYTLHSMNNLAVIYSEQGRLNEAEHLHIQTLEGLKIRLGFDHPDTLTSMNNLASTYSKQGRLNDAEHICIQILEGRKIRLGLDHLDTLYSMNNLAAIYSEQGRLNEAEHLHIQTLEGFKIKLGLDHPNTLQSMNNLATTYYKQGRLNEAEHLEKQVLEVRKRLLGPSQTQTLAAMRNLAVTWESQDKLDDAIALIDEYMALLSTKEGMEHPDYISSRDMLDKWSLKLEEQVSKRNTRKRKRTRTP